MGTVHATTSGNSPDAETSGAERSPMCLRCDGKGSTDPGNPGSYRDIHKKVTDLYPQNFEGARLSVKKKLSNHFRVSHALTLSPVTPSGYKFGAFYEGTTTIGKNERYPSLGCAIMPNGNQTIEFMNTLGVGCGGRARIKLSAQIANKKYEACATELEYRSDNCTMSVRLKKPNSFNPNGALALYFLQAVSSGLALGAEMAYPWDDQFSTNPRRATIAGAARYSTGPSTLSASVGEAGLRVCCHRRASEQLELGVELQVNLRNRESQGTLLYRIDMPKADLIYRGMLDSEWTVSGVFEKILSSSLKSSLLLSGALNHAKGQFRVGIGLNVG